MPIANKDQAKQIYNGIKSKKINYAKLNDDGKKAFWQYMHDSGLVNSSKLNDAGKGEFNKYVDVSNPIYSPQAGHVEQKLYKPDQEQDPNGRSFFYSNLEGEKGLDLYERLQMNPNREQMTVKPTLPQPKLTPTQRRVNEEVKPQIQPPPLTGVLTNKGTPVAFDPQHTVAKELLRIANTAATAIPSMAVESVKGGKEGGIVGSLKGMGKGLAKAANFSNDTNSKAIEEAYPEATDKLKQTHPNAYGVASGTLDLVGLEDLLGLGAITNAAKVAKLKALPETTKALEKLFSKYGKDIPQEAKEVAQKAAALEAKADKTPQEMDDYYAMIEYLDEINRKSPEYIKSEARLNVPKAKEIKTLTKEVPQKPDAYAKEYLDAIGSYEKTWQNDSRYIEREGLNKRSKLGEMENTPVLKLEGKTKPPVIVPQALKPNKPILSALDAKVNKPYDAPKPIVSTTKPMSKEEFIATLGKVQHDYDGDSYHLINGKKDYTNYDILYNNYLKTNGFSSNPSMDAPKPPLQRIEQPQIKPNSIGSINTPLAGKPLKMDLKPSKLKKGFDKFYSATVDNTATTAKVSKEAEIMSNVARNSGATVDHIIKKGLVNMEGQKIEGKAIADIFNKPENEAQALETLLFETHNIDRVHQAKELTGHTTEESKQIIAEIKKQFPHLEAEAKEVNKLLNNMLNEWGVKSGLVGSDTRDLVQGIYKNYVPGYRELNGVDAVSFKSRGMGPAKIINKAIGGDDKLMSLQKSIPMLISKTIKSARKNELYNEILKAAEKGSSYAKALEPAGKIEEVVEKKAADKMLEAIKADGIDALANITDSALTADPKLGYLLTVMKEGKPVKLQINEDLFKSLQALNGKGDDDLQAALKLFKKGITNPFKALVTGYNPIFALKNIFIDTPTAYIQGAENNPIKFVKNRIDAAKGILKNTEEFQEYKALGGEGSNFLNVEKGLNAKGKLEKPLKVLGAFNNATESWNRYGEYLGTIKREGSDYATKMKALSDAQEVTTNFGRHGDVTKAIDAIVPYFNPAVQGLDKTARVFKNSAAWAKALGVITAPTAAVYAINQIVDKKGYDQLDNRTKDTYYVFPMGDGEFFKVPKNRQSGVLFGALFERILRQAQGDPEAFKGFGNTLRNNMLVQNPWTDNIASPLVSGIGYNKDFAGRDVIPKYMSKEGDKRSAYLQFDEKTSEIAKSIGKQFNLSPKQIDYIMKSYGGIVASILIPATTKGGNVVENVVKRPFTADAAYNNEITNSFYSKIDKLKNAATDKNITMKLPSKLVTPEEKMSNLYASMTRQISDVKDGITKLGATDEARAKQQELLSILTELNKDIDYNQANRLKTQLTIMAKQYKK